MERPRHIVDPPAASPEVEDDDSIVVLDGADRLSFIVHNDKGLQPLVRYSVLARTLLMRSNEMSTDCDMHFPHERLTAMRFKEHAATTCCLATVNGFFEVNY